MKKILKMPIWALVVILAVFWVLPGKSTGFSFNSLSEIFSGNFLAKTGKIIQVTSSPVISITPAPASWTILGKLKEGSEELSKMTLWLGKEEKVFYERRFSKDGKEIQQKRKAKEMEIGLELLDLGTGEVEIVKVRTEVKKEGVNLILPEGFNIELVERQNGIVWNDWNNYYRVKIPTNHIVILNAVPYEEQEGRKKVVKNFVYSPHSDGLQTPEFVAGGAGHIKSAVTEVFRILRERGVKSKAFSDKLVVDVFPESYFQHLPLLEQSDFMEFTIDSQKTMERVLVIAGANGFNAWSRSCNSSGACGIVQFTNTRSVNSTGTYSTIARMYPAAKLIKDFKTGAGDQINALMAAVLLYDSNLSILIKKYGEDIASDPRLEEYLAALYNSSSGKVLPSIKKAILKGTTEWTDGLLRETSEFIAKLRYLKEHDLF